MNTKTKHWASITAGILSLAGNVSASSLGSEKYTYDASGNIVEKSMDGHITKMCYHASNRLTATSSQTGGRETVSYDDSGRPVLFHDASAQVIRRFKYAYADKVTAVEHPQEGASSELFYNAEGLLVAKKDRDGAISTYTWDGISLAALNDGVFVTEDGIEGGTPSLCSKTDEVIVSDHLGTTLQRGTKGFSPTAYGEGLEEAWFTGKPYIAELEGYAFKHRTYSSAEGRWRTSDPVGFPDGTNSFAYLDDPNSGVDPLGTQAVYEVYKSAGAISAPGANSAGSASFSYAGADYSSSFNLSIECTGIPGGTSWPNPKKLNPSFLITNVSEDLFWTTATGTGNSSFMGGGSAAIRVNVTGKNTSTIDFHTSGAVAGGAGTVGNAGFVDVAPTTSHIIATATPGATVQWGNVQYKTREL